MFLSTNTSASFVTMTEEVSTSLYGALQTFKPGFVMQDSFTFDTIFGTFLVACEGHDSEIYVDTYLGTQCHRDVIKVISGMFFVLYGKYKGYDCDELITDLDYKFKIVNVKGEYGILNLKNNKIYFSHDGDEETSSFTSGMDLYHIDLETIETQTFSSWAESLVFPSSSPNNKEDGLGNLWEGLPF